jgi:hypothetical protein
MFGEARCGDVWPVASLWVDCDASRNVKLYAADIPTARIYEVLPVAAYDPAIFGSNICTDAADRARRFARAR